MGVRSRIERRPALALLPAAFVLAILGGCAPVASVPEAEVVPVSISRAEIPSAVRTEIDRLLAQSNLNAADGEALTWDEVLDSSELGTPQYVDASKPVGLDLASHIGQSATWYTVLLRERSRSGSATSTASFVVVDGQVVGAGLHVWNSYPGVFALDDHSEIATSSSQ